jgi:alkaline phosphatase
MRRRDLIRGGVWAALAGLTGAGPAAAAGLAPGPARGRTARGADRRVRNIIFFAYDGLNYEDLAVVRYAAEGRGPGRLALERVLSEGSAGSMLTHSLTSVVTDSAAASTAWAAGRKVVNEALSLYPDGTALTTILELARDAGKATGLITTTRLTHATPAGWVAKVADRSEEDRIAEQYVAFQPDVMLGGGRKHFTASGRGDGRDLEAELAGAGYRVVRSAAELGRAAVGRVFGAFTEDHLPFEVDRRFQGAPGPSLAAMTAAGLAILGRYPEGFVVQVEAGRIDHANHENDPGACFWDVLAADEALAVVLEFVARTPDTLVLVASDHATGGQVLYGMGDGYRDSTAALRLLDRQRASYEHLVAGLPAEPTAAEVQRVVREYLGVSLSRDRARDAARVLADTLRTGHPHAHGTEPGNSFHQVVSGGFGGPLDWPNINFGTGAHTAGLVPVAAYGAWSGPANLGVVDNTELFGWMARALGSDFRNPLMTGAEALRLGAGQPERVMSVR